MLPPVSLDAHHQPLGMVLRASHGSTTADSYIGPGSQPSNTPRSGTGLRIDLNSTKSVAVLANPMVTNSVQSQDPRTEWTLRRVFRVLMLANTDIRAADRAELS